MGIDFKEKNRKRKVSLKNMLAYGSGDLYGGGSFFIISTLFMIFLTDIVKLAPYQAGIIVAAGKLWDAITDPTMGYISDNTKSKLGRRKVFFLIGIVPIAVSFFLIWVTTNFSWSGFNFIYYFVTFLLFNTVFTMVMVPYNTLGAEMTSDYSERSKMTGIRMAFSQFSALIGAVIPMKIIRSFSGSEGYLIMGIVFGIFYCLPWVFVYKGTWERVNVDVDKERGSLIKEIRMFFVNLIISFKNKSLRLHISMYLGAYVAMDIFNALLLYFVTYYLLKENVYTSTLGIVLITQVIFLYVVSKECMKLGNAKAYRIHTIIWIIGILAFAMLTPTSTLPRIFINAIIVGIGISGAVMIPWNILPFVTDVDEIITTKRREGIYAGLMTFIRKVAQAIALFFVGVGLDIIGYVPNIEQNSLTLRGLKMMIMIAPILLIIFGIITSLKFKITPENHKVLLCEIERLKKGGKKSEVSQRTKKICEDITGLEYRELWGRGDR